jgi:hypothetical protein
MADDIMWLMHGSPKAAPRLGVLILMAALLAGGPPARPAAAQTVPAAEEADPPAGARDAPRAETYTRESTSNAIEGTKLESLLGRELRTRDEDPGRIIDILCDRDGLVRAAVVELGGFLGIGTRRIAVDWSMLKFDAGPKRPHVVLDMTRDQLRSAPEYKPGEPAVFVRRAD